jgi:hypothetical protein
MTKKELLKNINTLLGLIGTCEYENPIRAKISQKNVIKAYDILFKMKNKLTKEGFNDD